jgi:hypothetical protein
MDPDPRRTFRNSNGSLVQYDDVILACDGEPFKASFNQRDAKEIKKAVNRGIDSHLEGCFIKGKDSYEWDPQKGKLECSISPGSLAVLLRRLFEFDGCSDIAEAILISLGFNERGEIKDDD